MRIDTNQPAQERPELPDSQRASQQVSGTGSLAAPSSLANGLGEDQAQLTDIHGQVQALVAQLGALPETSQEKVTALRAAVVGRSYSPQPNDIAGALFAHLITKLAA